MKVHFAPAKINLGLEIIRKREDGYHLINSVFLPIPLYDELSFAPADTVCIDCGSSVPADESNLCIRAALALKKELAVEQGIRVTLKKNIPIGAGLGGGSSDAATTLLALNEMWGINAPLERLYSIAEKIGADVPFFLSESAAIVGGIGEQIQPVDFSLRYPLLLVCPDLHISTAWAYSQVVCTPEKQETKYQNILGPDIPVTAFGQHFRNDFEQFIFPSYEELPSIKEQLLAAGAAFASLTGSGSGLYGIFDSPEKAALARRSFDSYRTFLFH
ncbi:MAG TPA: 4-(cytidine 5'-diphospho)-2-C-methyl-D-erythritol kinase [Candidatus Kapabacteria bacterium]|nr:4-(cytidine 5'-diphospho)-2-C-methyl-D-erythritol kinase [Candidatus Kapabacteria bacterium]